MIFPVFMPHHAKVLGARPCSPRLLHAAAARSRIVDVDHCPVGLRHERVQRVVLLIERGRVCSAFRRDDVDATQTFGIEDLDDSRVADGHVEMPPPRVEEDHVRGAGQFSDADDLPRVDPHGYERMAVAGAEQPSALEIDVEAVRSSRPVEVLDSGRPDQAAAAGTRSVASSRAKDEG